MTATDDGLNTTAHTVEGGGEQVEDGVLTTISGGSLTIAAGSDGIDSNGSATITGGTVAISAQSGGGGNGALDVNGTLTAPGVLTIDASSVEIGQRVTVTEHDGAGVATFVASDTAPSVVVMAAAISSGATYTVYAGDASSTTTDGLSEIGTATATEASQTATGMGGGPGGGPGGRRGGAVDG